MGTPGDKIRKMWDDSQKHLWRMLNDEKEVEEALSETLPSRPSRHKEWWEEDYSNPALYRDDRDVWADRAADRQASIQMDNDYNAGA